MKKLIKKTTVKIALGGVLTLILLTVLSVQLVDRVKTRGVNPWGGNPSSVEYAGVNPWG